jgi:hypothetical protein
MKLQLPTVTLICIDCLDANRAIVVLEHCKKMVDFGAVKLLSHIPIEYQHRIKIKPLNSLNAYSIFMLSKIYQYIETDHLLVVQRDGFILNPQSFNPEWLTLDFIGPLFMQMDGIGSGGCSLRSRKIMEAVSKTIPEWDCTQKEADRIQKSISFYEDGMLSLTAFSKEFKIASLKEGADWGQGGNRNPKYFREYPFSFHRTWQNIDFKTGRVDSSDTTADLHVTYDHEIDSLV